MKRSCRYVMEPSLLCEEDCFTTHFKSSPLGVCDVLASDEHHRVCREWLMARDQDSWWLIWLSLLDDNSGEAPEALHCHTVQATLARARRAALAKAQKEEAEEKLSSDHVAEDAARRREAERRHAREDQGGKASGCEVISTSSAVHNI